MLWQASMSTFTEAIDLSNIVCSSPENATSTMRSTPPAPMGAAVLGVEPVNGRGLGDVETFALGDAFGDVEEHHVPQFLQADEVGERPADHSSADERDLLSSHGKPKV